jgi:ribonuclease P protein component
MGPNGGEARKRERLSRSGDFERAYREGSSEANRHLILYVFPRPDGDGVGGTRLGISVGRKVGGAVERNRVKRALRECFWSAAGERRPDRDVVIVARPGVLELVDRDEPGALCESLEELLGATGVLGGPSR